ncbi:MAG: corrinoid protein [Bacillota bacterium]
MGKSELLEKVAEAVLQGNAEGAVEFSRKALEAGINPLSIILEGANKGMQMAGDLYEKQEYYVPELLLTADAMQSLIDFLKPHIKGEKACVTGTVVLGVVAGDIHSIGKNIVKLLLEVYGFNVIDLGEDVPAEEFIKAAREHKADIIGMSSLMTTTMMEMKNIIQQIKQEGFAVLTIIGGAPVNEEFKEKIEADAYAADGNKAVQAVLELLRKRGPKNES